MTTIAYEIRDLVKQFSPDRPPANDGLTLKVHQGEVFGLLGPNGAGKTTLVRQMVGLCQPTSGSLELFGHDLVESPELASQWVAVQPQGISLPWAERTGTLVELTGQLRGLSQAEARRQSAALLEEFGLEAHATRPWFQLSGGLRRLVGIACALIGQRPVLVFDEPTNDLDPEIRRVVWQRIRQAANRGATVILVTHNVVEAEQVMDRVAIMRAGRFLSIDTPAALKARLSQQIRLELSFRPENTEQAESFLTQWSDVHRLGRNRFSVVLPRSETREVLDRVLPSLDWLDDFRVVTPNLEDVYIALSGGESLAS